MLVSYVLRLVDSEAKRGHLVGEIESVRTGDIHVFRSAEDLARAVRESEPELLDDLPNPETRPWTDDPDASSD